MAVDRKLLAQALSRATPQGQNLANLTMANDISKFSMNSANFGQGQGRDVGLAAQLATAGVGAYSKYKAEKSIAEEELASQQQFAKQFPQFADLAGQLSPETRQAYTTEVLKQSLKSKDPEKTFSQATSLRADYLNNSKEFQTVRSGYERMEESAKDPSPAGDLALIFNYMKMLDPGSTVREGEFANAQNAGSLPQTLVARYNKVISGERLEDGQRADFVDRGRRLYTQAEKTQKKTADQYSQIAQRNGIDPKDVIIDFNTSIEKAPAGQSFDPNAFKDLGTDAITAEIARRKGAKK